MINNEMVCDKCGEIMTCEFFAVTSEPYIKILAKLQGWAFVIDSFGLRKDICPMCQIVDPEENKDMGRAINDLLNGEEKDELPD